MRFVFAKCIFCTVVFADVVFKTLAFAKRTLVYVCLPNIFLPPACSFACDYANTLRAKGMFFLSQMHVPSPLPILWPFLRMFLYNMLVAFF